MTAEQPTAPRPPRRRRLYRVALGLLAVPLVLALAIVLLVDSDAVVRRVVDVALPQASELIGRPITVDGVALSIVPRPSVNLTGLSVAGSDGEAEPLLRAGQASGRLALWPLVRSLGKDVQVSEVSLADVAVHLERRKDGTWAHDEVLQRWAQLPPSERVVSVDRLTFRDGVVKVTDRLAAGGTSVAALTDIDVDVTEYGAGRPTRVTWRAALQAKEQNLSGDVQVDALPASFAGLDPEQWPKVKGRFALSSLPIGTVRGFLPPSLATTVGGGTIRVESRLRTAEDGRYEADGEVDLVGLSLRGTPADGKLIVHGGLAPANPQSLVVDVREAGITGEAVSLNGTAQLRTNPLRVTFSLAGPLLDLAVLAGDAPPEDGKAAPSESLPLLSSSARESLRAARVEGDVAIDKVVRGKLEASNLRAKARLVGGELRLSEARADFFGGSLDAGGTRVNLAAEQPDWKLAARLDTVDVGGAMQHLSGTQPIGGNASGTLSLAGVGVSWQHVREVLDGNGRVTLRDARLPTAALGAELTRGLRDGLAALARGKMPDTATPAETPDITKDLDAWFTIEDGWLRLQRPIAVELAGATMQLGGRVGLDQGLDLDGTALVSPELVSRLSGGKLKPSRAFELPVRIGGTLAAPRLASLDTKALASAIVGGATSKARERVEDEARSRLQDLFRGF